MISQTAKSSLEVTRSPVQVTSMFYKVQQAGAILSGIAPSPSAEVHHFLTKYKILQISASLPSQRSLWTGGMQDLDESSSHSLASGWI